MSMYDGPEVDPFASLIIVPKKILENEPKKGLEKRVENNTEKTDKNENGKTGRAFTPDPSFAAASDRLVRALSERLTANGTKHKPTWRWSQSAESLMRLDNRSEDEIMLIIEWSTQDDFWRSNILSMPTLRKQFEKLRLQSAYLRWRQLRDRRMGSNVPRPAMAPVSVTAAHAGRIVDRERSDEDYRRPL